MVIAGHIILSVIAPTPCSSIRGIAGLRNRLVPRDIRLVIERAIGPRCFSTRSAIGLMKRLVPRLMRLVIERATGPRCFSIRSVIGLVMRRVNF